MPEVNDTLRVSNSFFGFRTDSVYRLTGENVNWDFSHLRPISQELQTYERAIFTPYGVFFLGFNKYGVKEADSLGIGQFKFRNIYQYFQSNNGSFQVEGIGLNFQGVPIPAYYFDNDELYSFPLDFGDVDSTTFAFQLGIEALGGAYESIGYRKNEVDGYGTITTPYGTFECIRVKATVNSTDSISIGGFAFGIPNNRLEYKWLAKDERTPILEISGSVIRNQFIPTRVRYKDVYRSEDELTVVDAPEVAFEANNLAPNVGDTVRFESRASELTLHQWLFSPDSVQFVNNTSSNVRNPEVVFTQPGSYSVTLAVNNTTGSADTTLLDYINVGTVSDTKAPTIVSNFEVFPNPISDIFYIFFESKKATNWQLSLYQQDGKLIHQFPTAVGSNANNNLAFRLPAALVDGSYFLQLTAGKQVFLTPIIVTKK